MRKSHRFLSRSIWKASLLLLAIMMISAACANSEKQGSTGNTGKAGNTGNVEAEKLSVVTSFYPLYFMATEIGGEHVHVTNLIPTGVEPHDWAPKSKEVKTLTDAALFLYHGIGLEGWVDSFVRGLPQDSTVMMKQMSEGIAWIDGDHDHDHGHEHKDEEDHEHEDGHEHAHEDEHEHDHDHDKEESEEEEGHSHSHAIDPHTWVSPKSALQIAENVKNSLIEVDGSHAQTYEANYATLREKLEKLDQQYEEQLAKVTQRNIVVSHQAFAYLARDYNLEQHSIMGLNPEAEPLAQDILKLTKIVKEQNIQYIFFEELISDDLAQMLASEAGVQTMVLHPLEGLTKEQEKSGENFLTLMEHNLHNLTQALQ